MNSEKMNFDNFDWTYHGPVALVYFVSAPGERTRALCFHADLATMPEELFALREQPEHPDGELVFRYLSRLVDGKTVQTLVGPSGATMKTPLCEVKALLNQDQYQPSEIMVSILVKDRFTVQCCDGFIYIQEDADYAIREEVSLSVQFQGRPRQESKPFLMSYRMTVSTTASADDIFRQKAIKEDPLGMLEGDIKPISHAMERLKRRFHRYEQEGSIPDIVADTQVLEAMADVVLVMDELCKQLGYTSEELRTLRNLRQT